MSLQIRERTEQGFDWIKGLRELPRIEPDPAQRIDEWWASSPTWAVTEDVRLHQEK